MTASAADSELFNPAPADATVDGFVEDPANPGWAEVSLSDGRTVTMPTEQATSLPQTPPAAPAPVYGGDAAGFGAPPPAVIPGEPNALAREWEAAGQDPLVQTAESGIAAPGYVAPVGRPTNPALGTAGMPGGTAATLPGAQVDPMAEIISPGSPGGTSAPFSESTSQSSTTSSTVDDPQVMQDRLASAADAEAGAQLALDQGAYDAKQAGLDAAAQGYAAQEAEITRQKRQAEIEVQEHQKFIQAVEKNPIDEDGFWNDSPGRKASAWIALALSGFLSGATRGQNPALGQMMQSLDGAQNRWLANQQRSRDGVLARRERAMGNKQNAIDSASMQLSGIMAKKIDLEAQRAGMPAPPGLETYKAKLGLKAAEAQNAIGSRVRDQATIQSQQEARATGPTGPVRRGDVALQQLGVEKKAHADAMDPKGLNLGGVVGGAERLSTVHKALEAIAARNGGQLPSQETFSWSTLGLAPQAARLGIGGGKDEVSVKQLMEEAKLAYKQTVNIKSIDSENEGKNFNAIIDSGEGESTLEAIRTRAEIANQNAVGIASGVSRDAQGYLNFVRGGLHSNPGVTQGEQPATFKPIGLAGGKTAPEPSAASAASAESTGGAPAQSAPLAHPGARALETSATGSRPGTYQRLRGSKPVVPR